MTTIRVAVADDHPVILAGLGMMIEAERDIEIVGQAASGPAALELIRDRTPDIAIIDISLPLMNGIELATRLRDECPSVGLVVLTVYEDRAHLDQALLAGARGYVLKKSATHCLINAIRGVWVGGLYVDPTLAAGMFLPVSRMGQRTGTRAVCSTLTARETDVIKRIAAGLTVKQIALQLNLSASSIETYKARAAEKCDLKTREEIVRYASNRGWLANIA